MGRNLGGLGETTLQSWAHEEGLVLNKVEHDETGWDFLLEWPSGGAQFQEDLRVPLDKVSAPLQCLVQVKASDSEKPSPKVKLDNWHRFITSPLPTFFLLLSFQGRNSCVSAYLIHVWEPEIRKIQRRLRQLSSEDPLDHVDLRKRRSVVQPKESERLSSLNGAALASAIRGHVGADLESYSVAKQHLVRNVGYEEAAGVLDMRFSIPEGLDPHDYLVDFALGIVPHIDISGGHARDVRFGIPSNSPSVTFPPGTKLRIGKRDTIPARLTASLIGIGRTVDLDMRVVFPRGLGQAIPGEYLRILFRSPFMEIQVRPRVGGEFKINFRLPPPAEEYDLADARAFAKLIALRTDAAAQAAPLQLTLKIKGKECGSIREAKPPPLPDIFVIWAKMIRDTWVVARHFEVESDLKITHEELSREAPNISTMAAVLQPEAGVFRYEYSLADSGAEIGYHCLPIVAEATLRAWTLQVGAALIGVPRVIAKESESTRYLLEGRDVRLHKAERLSGGAQPRQSLADIRNELADRYGDRMTVIRED